MYNLNKILMSTRIFSTRGICSAFLRALENGNIDVSPSNTNNLVADASARPIGNSSTRIKCLYQPLIRAHSSHKSTRDGKERRASESFLRVIFRAIQVQLAYRPPIFLALSARRFFFFYFYQIS